MLTMYGPPGSFGELEHPFDTVELAGLDFPAGIAVGRLTIDPPTGQVLLSLGSQRGNGAPTADHFAQAAFDKFSRSVSYVRVPLTSGETEIHQVAFDGSCNPTVQCYGGSGAGDILAWYTGDSWRFLVLNFSPYNNWQINAGPYDGGHGHYPVFAAFALDDDGNVTYDETLSRTADEIASASPVGASIFQTLTNSVCFGSETWLFAKGLSESAVFPNGHKVFGQYFVGGGGGVSGHVLFLDEDNFVTAYFTFPDFYHPAGALPPSVDAQPINLAVRTVQTDPTATDPANLRCIVGFDIFAPTARTVTRVSRTNNLVTYTTSANHGYGVGMYALVSGLTGADASFNDPSFSQNRQQIVAVTATTFTRRIAGSAVADHAVAGAGRVTTSTGAALVELAYDSTTGDVTPKSNPIYTGVERRTISTVQVHPVTGDLWVNERTTVFAGWGPLSVYVKDPVTGERKYVTESPADPLTWDVDGWDSIVEPDHRFASAGSLAGNSITNVFAIDGAADTVIFGATSLVGVDADPGLALGDNLQDDPGFETVDPASTWTGFFSVASADSGVFRSGSKSMKVNKTLAGLGSVPMTSDDFVPVDALQSYELEMWVRPQDSGVSGHIGLTFYDADQVNLNTPGNGPTYQLPAGVWTKMSAAVAVPAAAVFAQIFVQCDDVVTINHFYNVDDVVFRKAPGEVLGPVSMGISTLPLVPIAGASIQPIQGEIDAARRRLWVPFTQNINSSPCPAVKIPQYLLEVDLDPFESREYAVSAATAGASPRAMTPVQSYTPDRYPGRTFGPRRSDTS